MLKTEKKHLLKALIAIPLCLILYCYELSPGAKSNMELTAVFAQIIFGVIDFEYSYVYIMTIENIAFIILFNLLFSGHITSHFRYSCVYVFSRLTDRKKWYSKRALEIMSTAFLYSFLYVLMALLVSMNAAGKPLDVLTLYRVLLVFLFAFLIVSSTTLLINILALRFGTAPGLFMVEGALFALIALLMFTYKNSVLVMMNPLACLNLFQLGANTGLFTVVYNFAILIAVFFAGRRYVSNYDVAMFDAELN